MRCKQPLHICTTQLNVFEWVDTFFDVWCNGPSFCKKPLPLLINLWLSTPILSQVLPVRLPSCIKNHFPLNLLRELYLALRLPVVNPIITVCLPQIPVVAPAISVFCLGLFWWRW